MIDDQVTEDKILNGQITIYQPTKGYRIAIDPIFLAAFVGAKSKDKVLDVGFGVGAASLCLAKRINCNIWGIESQENLVSLAKDNIIKNNFSNRVQVIHGDLINPPDEIPVNFFDHVISNPPYYSSNSGKKSFHFLKNTSNIETTANIKNWIDFCLSRVKPKGYIELIYNADKLDYILSLIYGKVGEIVVFPLWPKKNSVARRVLIRGRRNVFSVMRICSGIVLHEQDGKFTEDAKKVLNLGFSLNV